MQGANIQLLFSQSHGVVRTNRNWGQNFEFRVKRKEKCTHHNGQELQGICFQGIDSFPDKTFIQHLDELLFDISPKIRLYHNAFQLEHRV